MKRKSAVIFPGTVPATQVLIPLVLVFEPVVYYQPVENDDSRETLSTLCEAMVERSSCSLHAPAPLGDNRDRFLQLVRDIRERRDDYTAQLAHVSLASISTGSRPSTESKSSILSSLLSGHGIESAGQEQKEKLLWQARLILKMAEQHDVEQQKINEDMQNIRAREQNLFAGLSHENGSPFSLTGKMTSLVSDTDSMQRFRLKAWARIFAFGLSPLVDSRFFVSENPDAVDRLVEEYERNFSSCPASFLTIPLPVRYPDENRFLEQLQQFQQDEAIILAHLFALLEDPSIAAQEHHRMFSVHGSEWSALIDQYFPEQDCGRCHLGLYYLPKVKVRQLFLDSFGHDEDDLRAAIAEETTQDVVIGLLAEQ